jgi:hypothetical protein
MADEPAEIALTLPSSWDEDTEYVFSMTEALFYCEHPHALDRVLDEVDLVDHRAAVARCLRLAVADFRRLLGEQRWQAFEEALRRRVQQSAAGAEFCWRHDYVPDGLDLFTLYELYRRGWVNVFSAEPVELDDAEARGLDYGDDFNDLAGLGHAHIHDS